MLTSKKVWYLSTVVALSLYAFMLLVTVPYLYNLSKGLSIPDMLPGGYDIAYIHQLFTALGEKGREYYASVQLPLDMIYPLAFSLMSINCIKRGIPHDIKMKKYMLILPIISLICDYAENISMLFALRYYPNLSALVIQFSSIASLIKTVTVVFVLVILLILGINFLRKKLTHKK